MNRHCIQPHSRKMYPKFTCSCCKEISTIKTISAVTFYFPADLNSAIKTFLTSFNKSNKKYPVIFIKGTAISSITQHACILLCWQLCICINRKPFCRKGLSLCSKGVKFFFKDDTIYHLHSICSAIRVT